MQRRDVFISDIYFTTIYLCGNILQQQINLENCSFGGASFWRGPSVSSGCPFSSGPSVSSGCSFSSGPSFSSGLCFRGGQNPTEFKEFCLTSLPH